MIQPFIPPPLSLYIHYPWCIRKCGYCDFNSHQIDQFDISDTAYTDALICDTQIQLPAVWGRRLSSVFIGGGTPSLWQNNELERLLSHLRSLFVLPVDAEITLEANPGTVDSNQFEAFLKAGINRLSIGIQSFNNPHLRLLGRIHHREDALGAVSKAKQAGFSCINLDLMYGLPRQSVQQAINDLQQAIQLQPAHLSWYQLTLEPNTQFDKYPPAQMPSEEVIDEIMCKGAALLQQYGYQQYEISAWSQEGFQCQHNLNYWQFGDYLGIGSGAHGKITIVAEQKVMRTLRPRQPKQYMQTIHHQEPVQQRILGQDDLIFEFMLNALRLRQGFRKDWFTQTTGVPYSQITQKINQAKLLGLLETHQDQIKPTDKGFRFLNDLLQIFL